MAAFYILVGFSLGNAMQIFIRSFSTSISDDERKWMRIVCLLAVVAAIVCLVTVRS